VELAKAGIVLSAVRPIAIQAAIAANLPRDRAPMTTQAAGDLADATPDLHQAAQTTSLLKHEANVIVS
jgi:hypothetical protein